MLLPTELRSIQTVLNEETDNNFPSQTSYSLKRNQETEAF